MKSRLTNLLLTLSALIMALSLSTESVGETFVRDTVQGVWNLEGSPYIVTNHLIVADDSTLVIEPGVEVTFRALYRFMVYGKLEAIGTVEDSIYFGPEEGMQGWGSFRFLNADSLTHLAYCILTRGRAWGGDAVPDSAKSGGNAFISGGDVLIEHSRIYLGNCNYTGGGIAIWNSDPIIRDCIISGNVGGTVGGGIGIERGSNPLIQNCQFIENTTVWGGGAIEIRHESSPIVEDCLFMRNAAGAGENTGLGGALYIQGGSDPIFRRCKFIENTGYAGGAVYMRDEGTDPLFEWCEFTSNIANTRDWVGGAIYYRTYAAPEIRYCTFTENGADYGGAIYANDRPLANIHHCLFVRNGATRGGGAICTSVRDYEGETLTISNCTFIDNRLTGIDVTPNAVWSRTGASVSLLSCIFRGEQPHYGGVGQMTVDYSHVQDYEGPDDLHNSAEDPGFYELDTTFYMLRGDSPCIDSGEFDLPQDPDETRNDRGWMHFPHNIWEGLSDTSVTAELTTIDRESVSIMLTNNTNVPVYATPVDRWNQSEPDTVIDVSEITEDMFIHGAAWTSSGYFLSGGNGDEDPQIYHLDDEFELQDQFDQPGSPGQEGYFDLATDGVNTLYGGGPSRITEFVTNGEPGESYDGPQGIRPCRALGVDFANPHRFVDFYIGGNEGILVRADGQMWERQRLSIADSIRAIGIKGNVRALYVATESAGNKGSLWLLNPDDSTFNRLFDFLPPEDHRIGGFEITQDMEEGHGKIVGIWEGDGENGDKLYIQDLYTSWLEIWPLPKLIMPGDSAQWDITFVGTQMEAGTHESVFQIAVNGFGEGGTVDAVMELEQSSVNGKQALVPEDCHLVAVYPNPFNAQMKFDFYLPRETDFDIQLLDVTGRKITAVYSGTGHRGYNTGEVSAASLPNGTYFLKLWTPENVDAKKIVILK